MLEEALAPLLSALDRGAAAPPAQRRRRSVATPKAAKPAPKAPRGRAPART